MADRDTGNPPVTEQRPYISSASAAIRDALRELLRSGRRRRLSTREEEMGRAMLDELETRQKAGKVG